MSQEGASILGQPKILNSDLKFVISDPNDPRIPNLALINWFSKMSSVILEPSYWILQKGTQHLKVDALSFKISPWSIFWLLQILVVALIRLTSTVPYIYICIYVTWHPSIVPLLTAAYRMKSDFVKRTIPFTRDAGPVSNIVDLTFSKSEKKRG